GVDDACDVAYGSVRVVARRVAECDLVRVLELADEVVVAEPATLAVLDRDRQPLARLAAAEKRRLGVFDDELDVPADERERGVRAEHAWQESHLGEDLEAVADSEHRTAVPRERDDGTHDW